MPRRLLLCVLLAFGLSQLGLSCGPPAGQIQVESPSLGVDTYSFDIVFMLGEGLDPDTLEVTLNHVSILDRFTGGPQLFVATIDPGAPLRDLNLLQISAERTQGGSTAFRFVPFSYLPPGKARAVRIRRDSQRIRGPLGHSRKGDYLLENDIARFVVQDAGQRELYSVGQYGGNLIDAERVDNPGKDNFLELQPGVNIETVINAQSVEIVNDGQDGTPARVRTCGPDDLLDFVNPSSQVTDLGIPFPALADDHDFEVEGCTTYSLAPNMDAADPQDYLRIDTEVFNNDAAAPNPLPLLLGDWLNPSGELDMVVRDLPLVPGILTPRVNGIGPPTTASVGAIGMFGFDEARGTDYALVRPDGPTNGSFAFLSGVMVMLHSDSVILALIGSPPSITVPLGGSRTITRYFGVGEGTGSTAFDLYSRINGENTGVLEGCITAGGVPVAGAAITAGTFVLSTAPADQNLTTRLATAILTRPGPCPNYSARVRPGNHRAVVGLEGHLYEGGLPTPTAHLVPVTANATTTFDVDLPAAGALHVEVTDELGRPMPARVTVVGFDPSPEMVRPGPTLPAFGGDPLGLLYDVNDALPFGVAAVGHADHTGMADLVLEPGVGLYHVVVSRGTEYSAFRTATPITITAGATTTVNAQLARVIDTPGFVSSDFHVHGIRSADSRVSDVHRVESYASEGVENVVMTDHHVHTDLNPAIMKHGMGQFLHATIGEEITTFDYGHFNAYPLLLDPDSPHATFDGHTQLSGGSTDWAKAAPPGMDFPSYGALNATPAEIHDLALYGPLSRPSTTVQINHIGSHFQPLRIDTSLVPPSDALTDLQRAQRRLPSTAAVPNLFQYFPALELWNGASRGAQSEFLDERIGIWFNHLNQGLGTTFVADTDSHRFTSQRTAGARTWTASPTDAPSEIDPADVAASVEAGRAVGGQGVYVQTRLLATDGSGDTADLTLAGKTDMTDAGGEVQLEITIQSPAWAAWDRVEIYRNAPTFPTSSPYEFGAIPDRVLDEGDCDVTTTGDGDFDVTVTPDVGGVPGADRHSATLLETFSGLTEETWFVVVVRGSDGQCQPMFPVYPMSLGSAGNNTLADLVDGNVGEAGVMALGATNALYFRP